MLHVVSEYKHLALCLDENMPLTSIAISLSYTVGGALELTYQLTTLYTRKITQDVCQIPKYKTTAIFHKQSI